MRLGLYAVFDSAVGTFAPPMALRSRGEAIRSFTDACKDPQSVLARHPSQFRLFYLGEYDDSTADFVVQKPMPVIGADEVG